MASLKPNLSSARTRLMATYLSIIMALTLGFSTVLYQQSISEAQSNLIRQQSGLKDFLFFTQPEDIARINNEQLTMFRRNLLNRLVVLNVGMLVLGGGVSYVLSRRSLRPLEQTLDAQSRFTSDAAHELRTPLTAMKAEIEVALMSKTISDGDAREVLYSNLEEIGKLDTLTAALLRLARSGDSVDKSHWQDYRLTDVLESASIRLKEESSKRKISISLPKTKALIHGDPDQLIELFVPLLSNALKYSLEGTKITVTSKKSDNKIKVNIADQGIGITAVDLPHIFERFYRADQSRNKSKVNGYGLGLSLADSIAKNHNGKITVTSEYGKGSIFVVELPSA